jgi:TonB family protein
LSEKSGSTEASFSSTESGLQPQMPVEDIEAASDKEDDASPVETVETVEQEVSDADVPVPSSLPDSIEPQTYSYKPERLAASPANFLTTATSIAWIAAIIYHGAAGVSIPWCLTLATVAIWALTTTRKKMQKHALAASRIGTLEEARFAKVFSATYLSVSVLMFAWFFAHGFKVPPPVVTQKQFIDIELTSFADFKDNDSLVASTEEKDSQRKRSGSTDKVSMTPPIVQPQSAPKERTSKETKEAGQRALQAVAPQRQTAAPTPMVLKGVQIQAAVNSANADIQAQQQKPEIKAQQVANIKLPSGWKSVQADKMLAMQNNVSPGVRSQQSRSASQSMFMEESSPVELFEMVDNDGDSGNEIFQAGGRSTGGKGAPSTLQEYLKQLHKRIKRAWTPPDGDPRVAQILFRVTKDGRLKQIRLLRSSGNPDSDEAAMNAISACAPFRSLPADFPSDSLDIKYTFNYKVDTLSEAPGSATH